MRTTTILLLPALWSGNAAAQWTDDVQSNTMVRASSGLEAVTPLMSDGPDGSTYVTWFENQAGGYELHMQRIDAQGLLLWGEGGLLVSDHPQNSALFRYDLKTDNDSNAIVAFQDERTGQLDIVVYKVDPDGNQLWGVDGVQLTDPASTQGLAPAIGVLTSNTAMIAWNATDGVNKWIAAQYIFSDGTLPSSEPHQISGPDNYSRPKVISTSDNGFIFLYVEEVGNFPFTCRMFAQGFDGGGNLTGNAQVSTKTISVFHFPEPVPDGHDGFYVPFTTGNPDNASLSDAYVQRVRGDFSIWSEAGTELMSGTSTQRFTGGLALLNDVMGLMAPVKVTNTAQSQGGWAVQRLDTAGVVQLGPDGVTIVPQSAQLASPDAVSSTLDGCIVVYSEGGFGVEHIKAARIGTAGNTVWGSGTIDVCALNSNKDDVDCGALSNGGQLVCVWQDDRSAAGIYAQNILLDGTVGPLSICDCAPPPGISVLQGPHQALLRVGDADGEAHVEVFDAGGRIVWQRILGQLMGSVRIELPQASIGQGAYVVRFTNGERVRSLRWLVW
ncbi:MAG: T9SS type A sorting domain-containing protein [Flavobacteriales bacterium]|nr:T9SS type A sorting domain-containing protein [Flavobacteriales bacterium]